MSNKRQNSWTDLAQHFCDNLHYSYGLSKLKNAQTLLSKNFTKSTANLVLPELITFDLIVNPFFFDIPNGCLLPTNAKKSHHYSFSFNWLFAKFISFCRLLFSLCKQNSAWSLNTILDIKIKIILICRLTIAQYQQFNNSKVFSSKQYPKIVLDRISYFLKDESWNNKQ